MLESFVITVGLFLLRVGVPLLILVSLGVGMERAYRRRSV